MEGAAADIGRLRPLPRCRSRVTPGYEEAVLAVSHLMIRHTAADDPAVAGTHPSSRAFTSNPLQQSVRALLR